MRLRLSDMDVWSVPSNDDGVDWDVVPSTLRNSSQRLTFDLQGNWAKLCHLGSILILEIMVALGYACEIQGAQNMWMILHDRDRV